MGLGGEPWEAARGARWLGAALLVAISLGAGCASGGGGDASPSSLKTLLPPAAYFPVKVQRSFEWRNSTDFVVQGLDLPDGTEPSRAIATIDRAGFEAGAGQRLAPAAGDLTAYSEVARFDSDSSAGKVLEDLHAQDLIRPCTGCGVRSRALPVPGIPTAKGAHQAPVGAQSPPSGAGGSFERYVVEFTIGRYLFIGKVAGQPGLVPEPLFADGMKSFYEHARRQAR